VQHFDDTPDETRPRNPWPRLLVFGAVILALLVAGGACLTAFINTGADPVLRLRFDELEPGVPRFEPITRWGADPDQFTYGIWVTVIPEVGTKAYLSRNVDSGCHMQWLATEQVGEVTGVFFDRCSGSSYAIDGTAVGGPATRQLDEFEVSTAAGDVRVDFRRLLIGDCRGEPEAGDPICNPAGALTTRTMPLDRVLPEDFAQQ
jgi:hypothetical protein